MRKMDDIFEAMLIKDFKKRATKVKKTTPTKVIKSRPNYKKMYELALQLIKNQCDDEPF